MLNLVEETSDQLAGIPIEVDCVIGCVDSPLYHHTLRILIQINHYLPQIVLSLVGHLLSVLQIDLEHPEAVLVVVG